MTNILELLKNEKVEWKKLGEVVEILDSKRKPIKKSDRILGNYPYYGANGIQDYVNDYIFDGTFILMGEDGSVMNKNFTPILHWIEKKKIWVNNHAHVLGNSSDCYNLKYIYYYLTTINVSGIVKGTPPKINQANLRDIEIPIPSLKIQQKIVGILDKFTNYVTELQTELQSRTKQYNYYRDMLLSEEYLNKITKEMEEDRKLRIEKLGDVCDLKRGKRLVKNELQEEGLFPVYQNSMIPLGYYHESNFSGNKTFIISAGSAGEIVYSYEGFWAADDVYVLNTQENILNKYLYYFLMSKQHIIKSKVRKASVPRISKEDIEKITITIPPISLQNKIVKVLDKFQMILEDTKGLLPEEIEQRQKQYEYYREQLLTFDKYCDSTHARTHARTHVDIV